MPNLLRKYHRKTLEQVKWALRYQEMPEVIVESTVATLKELRLNDRKRKAHDREMKKLWGEIINPLQHERRIVRSMLRYKPRTPTPERDEFVAAYDMALTKLYHKLIKIKTDTDATPEHRHWVDYVPEVVRLTLTQAAGDVPVRQKAKFKTPFERTLPAIEHNKQVSRLRRRTRTELETVERALSVDPEDEDLRAKHARIKAAMAKIKLLKSNEAVPFTWHGMEQM